MGNRTMKKALEDDGDAIEKLFKKYDKDKSGKLDEKEGKKFCMDLYWVLRSKDMDESDTRTLSDERMELVYAWARVSYKIEEENKLFHLIDKDKSGLLDYDEFKKFLQIIRDHGEERANLLKEMGYNEGLEYYRDGGRDIDIGSQKKLDKKIEKERKQRAKGGSGGGGSGGGGGFFGGFTEEEEHYYGLS